MAKNRTRGELKRLAREYLTGNYTTPILAMLLAVLCPSLVLSLFPISDTPGLNLQTVIYLLAAIIISILGQLLSISLSRIHLLLARRQDVHIGDLLWTFRNRADYFILGTVLLMLMLMLPVLMMAGAAYILFRADSVSAYLLSAVILLAGYILTLYVSYRYSLTFLLYIDHPDYSVTMGFRESRKLIQGHKWQLFLLQISFLGWYLLGICSLGIGLLWIAPYITQTTVNFYLDISGELDKTGTHFDATITDHTVLQG